VERSWCVVVSEKCPLILCIQETKLAVCNNMVRNSLWNNTYVNFSYQPSMGASGGLLTLLDNKEVEVWSTIFFEHVLGIQGRFVKSEDEFTIFNVYAPCDSNRQQVLWQTLAARFASLHDQNVCVCGDFNAVRYVEEHRSVGSGVIPSASVNFNQLIVDSCLVDLPLWGRRYTWYRGDGKSISRLNRFLLSERWCLTWPNCFQLASARGLSDHCLLQLCIDEENWGPRPVRMLKCWENFTGFNSFVREKWNSFQLEGWGGNVLKEKLKLIKLSLKEWHQRHAKNIPSRISNLKDRISALEVKGENLVLLDGEIDELHDFSEELFSLSRVNASIC